MRRIAVLLFLAACAEHGSGGGPDVPPGAPPLPAACQGHCISDVPVRNFEDCCDSVTCFLDPERNEWEVTFCDPPPSDACDACATDEQCVQQFDGTCGLSTTCVPRTVVCPDNACSVECEAAYCSEPFQCQTASTCGTESPRAFHCYGP